MTLPAPRSLPDLAEKALSLWRLLGLSDRALDELLTLPRAPGRERRAAPRGTALTALLDAYPVETIKALSADPNLPDALGHGVLDAAVGRLRLLLCARDALLGLAGECEAAAMALAETLERLTSGLRPPQVERPRMRPASARLVGRRDGVLRLGS